MYKQTYPACQSSLPPKSPLPSLPLPCNTQNPIHKQTNGKRQSSCTTPANCAKVCGLQHSKAPKSERKVMYAAQSNWWIKQLAAICNTDRTQTAHKTAPGALHAACGIANTATKPPRRHAFLMSTNRFVTHTCTRIWPAIRMQLMQWGSQGALLPCMWLCCHTHFYPALHSTAWHIPETPQPTVLLLLPPS
jgi:hypothetical protein